MRRILFSARPCRGYQPDHTGCRNLEENDIERAAASKVAVFESQQLPAWRKRRWSIQVLPMELEFMALSLLA